jgi:hypothetical protein
MTRFKIKIPFRFVRLDIGREWPSEGMIVLNPIPFDTRLMDERIRNEFGARFTHLGYDCQGKLIALNLAESIDVSDCDHRGCLESFFGCVSYCRNCGAEFSHDGDGGLREIGLPAAPQRREQPCTSPASVP